VGKEVKVEATRPIILVGRYEVCDMTLMPDDPRYSLFDTIDQCYVPGYWPSTAKAEAAARVMVADEKTVR
jgi:hypothetical protein